MLETGGLQKDMEKIIFIKIKSGPLTLCFYVLILVTQNEDLLNKLQGLSAGECVRVLREMPLSVSEKRKIRYRMQCNTHL